MVFYRVVLSRSLMPCDPILEASDRDEAVLDDVCEQEGAGTMSNLGHLRAGMLCERLETHFGSDLDLFHGPTR